MMKLLLTLPALWLAACTIRPEITPADNNAPATAHPTSVTRTDLANKAEVAVGTENALLTDAPFVPPPITRKTATKVVVHLEVKEVQGRLADGVAFTFCPFGG